MDNLLVGIGVWLFCDGIISIRLYYTAKDETGKRVQSWCYDHSVRLLRIFCAIVIIVCGVIVGK